MRVLRLLFAVSLLALPRAEATCDSDTPAVNSSSGPPASPDAKADASQPRGARMREESQRNENVAVYQIDNNAIKEASIRVGTSPKPVSEASVDASYFATEHGQAPSLPLALQPQRPNGAWHGDGFLWHQNSVFNARTFFQVGDLKPSHRNSFGGRIGGPVPHIGFLTVNASQSHVRGMVNGNVLVPLAEERTPLATDPETRALVQRFLDAYPNELPNRPDFDRRALNTNSPQTIDETQGTARLDTNISSKDRLLLSYFLSRQHITAFQLVAGQNPNTEIHSLRPQITWVRSFSPGTLLSLSASFNRNRSVLVSEPNAVGPRVRFGFQIEELGPDSQFPINRATNSYWYGANVTHAATGGRHTLFAGADITRFQLNGVESANMRGMFQFGNNFGRSAIDNLRWGTPSLYEVTSGELARGYRNWTANAYVADRWQVHSRLQLYYGLRYTADTAPYEVQNRDIIPYGCDCNNVSPRLSLAWQVGGGWTARAMYTTSFSQILPVTYQQVRNNPPYVYYVQLGDPDLVDPLSGIDLSDPARRYSPTRLSPDLVSPYSHQYNAVLERQIPGGALLRLGYIGSRTIKLLNVYIQNRADQIPGIPPTTANIDQRRPDPRYYDVRNIVNGGNAYFDAAQVTIDFPLKRGLAGGASYTFSKAIDEGVDFSATAANKDVLNSRSQWQYNSLRDRRGLSNFDSPHAFLAYYSYDLPWHGSGLGRAVLGGWQVSGVTMWKKGTPLTLFVGSDAPGFGNVDGGPSDRPHILDPSILGATIQNPDVAPQILQRDRFAYMSVGDHAGSLGRNTFRKAAIFNTNVAVTKQWLWRTHSEWATQVRAEAYNLTNTPQFDEPQRNLSSPAFGKITNTLNDGRVLQLVFRLVM